MFGFPQMFGFPTGKPFTGSAEDKAKVRKDFDRKTEYMRKHGVPIWHGEFGPVYATEDWDGADWEKINQDRYAALKDQLTYYDDYESPVSWTIWLYKDIGFQGMVYTSPDSAWIKHLKPWLVRNKKLAVDFYAIEDSNVVAGPAFVPVADPDYLYQ